MELNADVNVQAAKPSGIKILPPIAISDIINWLLNKDSGDAEFANFMQINKYKTNPVMVAAIVPIGIDFPDFSNHPTNLLLLLFP